MNNTAKSTKWPTANKQNPCPKCGHTDRCLVAADGEAGKCWRDGGKVWHASNGQAPGAGGYAGPARGGGEKKSYLSFMLAIEAVEKWKHGKRVADWTYRNADGGDVAKVVRLALDDGGKGYFPIHEHKSGWRISDPPGKWPVYRLDKLPATGTVYLCEGEKTADAAAGIGLAATTSAHGSSSASKTDWTPLAGRDVVILPDNDEAGRKYADDVIRLLVSLDPPAVVKVVNLPGLPDAGDIVEYLAAGGTREGIECLADQAEPVDAADVIGGPVLICAADLKPKPITWMWPGRIVSGAINLFNGCPGFGKSSVTIDAAARVSTGTPWPDGSPCPQGPVIIIAYEDDKEQVILPRLIAHGADTRKITFLDGVKRRNPETGKLDEVMFTLADVPALTTAILRLRPKLVIIDPAGSATGGDVDSHRDNEVRSVMSPLGKLAERYSFAAVVVTHSRKAGGRMADDMVMGSRAYTGISRTVWHIVPDPDDKCRRLFLAGKNNLGPPMTGLAFRIIDHNGTGQVVWEKDPVEMNADDALAIENRGDASDDSKPGPEAITRNAAAEWLAELLAGGPMASTKVKNEGKEAGYSWRTLHRAKDELGIKPYKEQFTGGWTWRLRSKSGDDPTCQAPKEQNNLASWHLGDNQLKNGDSTCQDNRTCQDILLGTMGNGDGREQVEL